MANMKATLDYLLVSNLLTRKIRAAWEKKTNEFMMPCAATPTERGSCVIGLWGMPVQLPVKLRRYDDAFWKELLGDRGKKSEAQNLKELGF
jgi:hypothetical protein